MYIFLQEDFDGLNEAIEDLRKKIKEIGNSIHEGSEQSSETWHDNFIVEDAQRQHNMLSKYLDGFLILRANAILQQLPNHNETVNVGHIVTVIDINKDEQNMYAIGSYQIFRKNTIHQTISYVSPLAKILLNARMGEIRTGLIGGHKISLRIGKIITPLQG